MISVGHVAVCLNLERELLKDEHDKLYFVA
jgi:hypothetical protein